MRDVTLIRFKRIHIRPWQGKNGSGHWWFEIGDPASAISESYGWWPSDLDPSLLAILNGLPGELNDGLNTSFPPRDPHHGEAADESFHGLVNDGDQRTDLEIADCLRWFARNYSGSWQWFFGWGQNCHTFQQAALYHCGLSVPPHIRKFVF